VRHFFDVIDNIELVDSSMMEEDMGNPLRQISWVSVACVWTYKGVDEVDGTVCMWITYRSNLKGELKETNLLADNFHVYKTT